jgi:hypothetical protein
MGAKKGNDAKGEYDERLGFSTKLGLEIMAVRRKYGLYDLQEYEDSKDAQVPRRRYAAFLISGRRKDSVEIREVEYRNPMGVRIPEKCYAFLFFDGPVEGEDKEPKNVSGKYYPEGLEISLTDALECFTPEAAESFLMERKKCGFDSAVEDRLGGIHPFYKQDRLVLMAFLE